jgi:E3 ubiquitin-protein transferase RMND5
VPEPFSELHKIWESIHQHELAPALEWATKFSKELDEKNSSLEFKLHRLAFMQVCEKRNVIFRRLFINKLSFQILNGGINAQSEAIQYARTNFAKFVDRFEKEIQILMGTLIYLPLGIDSSPYKYLTAPEMWIEVRKLIFLFSTKKVKTFHFAGSRCIY